MKCKVSVNLRRAPKMQLRASFSPQTTSIFLMDHGSMNCQCIFNLRCAPKMQLRASFSPRATSIPIAVWVDEMRILL